MEGIDYMAKIGEYRLKVYNLLYKKPICKYAVTAGKKKQSNVLILGTGWIGNEAFKAAFWAGQAIDTELNITVAARNASAYKEDRKRRGLANCRHRVLY